jgi:carbon storage regulator
MLVLTRRVNEGIVIHESIRIKVLAVQAGKVRLGIAAPPGVSVDRQEVHERRAEFAVRDPPIVKSGKSRSGKGV